MPSEDLGTSPREDEQENRPVFPSPFDFNPREPLTLVELRMRSLSGMIRQKPRWWEKIQDGALVAKWRAEMVEHDRVAREKEWDRNREDFYAPKRWPRDALTDAQLDYVFAELKHVASARDEQTGIHATSVPCVYLSGSLVPADLKTALVRGVAVLEDVPHDEKDWHPGSNRQVLDLVHPSLYCLRIGKSLVLTAEEHRVAGTGPLSPYALEAYLADRADRDDTQYGFSRTLSEDFQWLPTVFEVSETGAMERKSYINNLHPVKHASLYTAIISVLQQFIPMFEKVLSDAASPVPLPVIEADPMGWYSHIPEKNYDEEGYEEWWENRWPLVPDPPPFAPQIAEDRVDVNLKGRQLRVIVKLANIVLTPENPSYPGGSWHVEGMANEQIVATGLYYYASENITESRLAFRVQVGTDPESADMQYQQSDNQGWRRAFGFAGDDPLNQELGHVVAAEDRCVAFPNIYQHRVEPFELADRARPGHRKILAFFVTDPFEAVQSTAMVPPQQREWYLDEMERIPALRRLPRELYDIIADYVIEGTITRAEAEADRAELMEERREFVLQHNEDVFEVSFSLCEH